MDDLDHLSHSLTKTTLRICVSHIGAADGSIARSVSPGYRQVVCPPFLWLIMCGDVYEKRREVVQSSRCVGDEGAKLAVLLTRASSRAGNLGSHRHLDLRIVVPRKASDVEHAVGFLGCASSPHADEVKAEAWVCLKVSDANFCQLITARNVWNLEHQIPGRRLVGRS